jgi:Uma2 family endonuclease
MGGKVLFAPLRVKIRPRKFREPDLLLVLDAKDPRRQNRFWLGADLALEVVSPDKPARDLIDKRGDYAEAGIPEYWIVNPETETITVLRLEGEAYVEHGVFARGTAAESALLVGFSMGVDGVFDAD